MHADGDAMSPSAHVEPQEQAPLIEFDPTHLKVWMFSGQIELRNAPPPSKA